MLAARSNRMFFSLAIILGASGFSVVAARKNYVPSSPVSPDYRVKGKGKIVIVEYSDFQCPACGAAYVPLKQIQQVYGDDIQVHFKHFPLEGIHRWARASARAAECAGRQGEFWDMHDTLFATQRTWGRNEGDAAPYIAGYVKDMGLDAEIFKACMSDPGTDALIDKDVEEGNIQRVNSTPTFFINGKRFVGARQLSTVGTLWIEKQLKK